MKRAGRRAGGGSNLRCRILNAGRAADPHQNGAAAALLPSRPRAIPRRRSCARWRKKRAWAVLRPTRPSSRPFRRRIRRLKDGQAPGPDAAGRGGQRADGGAFPECHQRGIHRRDGKRSSTRSRRAKLLEEGPPEDFYAGFHQEMLDAEEQALDGVRLKVPDEVTDVICEHCGRNMVVKTGRFGKFLACPGYPGVHQHQAHRRADAGPLPGAAAPSSSASPQRGYAYYACERGAECGFMTWDVPTDQDCPVCGQTMFKRSGRGAMPSRSASTRSARTSCRRTSAGYRRRRQKLAGAATADNAAKAAERAAAGRAGEKNGEKRQNPLRRRQKKGEKKSPREKGRRE